MVTLVKDAIADEELRREPPQKLLVINRCTLGVFLSFKVPLHFMIPEILAANTQCHSECYDIVSDFL